MKIISVLILGIQLLLLCEAIFEDQIGKFDWRKQLIGCPSLAFFNKAERGSDKVIISTKENIMASLSLYTGEIEWRRILEKSPYSIIASKDTENELYTLSNDGIVRSWRKLDGILLWQLPVHNVNIESGDIFVFDKKVYVASNKAVTVVSINGERKFFSENLDENELWGRFVLDDNKIYFVSISVSLPSKEIIVKEVRDSALKVVGRSKVDNVNIQKCQIIGNLVSCYHSDTIKILYPRDLKLVEMNSGSTIKNVVGSSDMLAVHGTTGVAIYKFTSSRNLELLRNIKEQVTDMNIDAQSKHIVMVSSKKVVIVSLKDGTNVFEGNLPVDPQRAIAQAIFFSNIKTMDTFGLVYVGNDCRVEMLLINTSKNVLISKWTREESLIRVSSVEMVDLPLSESQQMIEDEFEVEQNNVISAFTHRIASQVVQLRRFLIRIIQKMFDFSIFVSSKANGIADIVNAVRNTARPSADGPFERDYFNLRKVIVASTLDGVIFGIDSANGNILWRFWLGNGFSPFVTQFGENKVPLFIQRTTSNYQLDGLAIVVFKDSVNSNGITVQFNPMNGAILDRKEHSSQIKKVSLLPFVGKDHVQSIIVFGVDDAISYIPEVENNLLVDALPIYSLHLDSRRNEIMGVKIDLINKRVKLAWSGSLQLSDSDQIIGVQGKPNHQKVHSQGRVLLDRNVQYKYVNPNLAVIAILDKVNQILKIVLIDVVSGQIVHTSTLPKANGPVHFVHSEHWIVYTYWSEKGRRTEIGVIELYEQLDEQNTKEVHDSRVLMKKGPVVMTQSYIYSQTIEAMSVSDTEKGLTTRSVLIALPSGNIHEVSRKLLDATRPMEMTQAMKEEMMIGYVPEIGIATEDMINYNQTVHRVKGIKTASSGLESTSLVLAYGTDLFYTRLTPSGTFDILKDDFDHLLIATVLAALVIGSLFTKKLAGAYALKAQWK